MSDLDEPLSDREIEILQKVATGASNKEIAAELLISPNTVKVHLRNIFTKIGVVSRTEATLYAIKHNLVMQPNLNASINESEETEITAEQVIEGSPLALLPDNSVSSPTPEEGKPRRQRIYLFLSAILLFLGILIVILLTRGQNQAQVAIQRTQQIAPMPSTPRWIEDSPLPASRYAMATFFYNNLIYLVGGNDGSSASSDVYLLDGNTKKWQKQKSKPTPTEGMRAILIGERVYLPGGKTPNGHSSNVMEVYNPRQNEWTSKKPLPVPLDGYAAASFEGQIYVFGGLTDNRYSNQVYIYNPQSDTWATGSNLPSSRAYASAEVFEGKILIAGGFDGTAALSDVLTYNPNRDTPDDSPWEKGPELPAGRYGMSSTSLANMVYLFGGKGAPGSSLPSLILQSQSKKWVEVAMPEMTMSYLGNAQAAGNFIHLLGGLLDTAPTDRHLSYQAIYTISIPLTNNQ